MSSHAIVRLSFGDKSISEKVRIEVLERECDLIIMGFQMWTLTLLHALCEKK